MKRIGSLGSHLLASIFFYSFLGLTASILLIQSKWLDMRFDSEYAIFIGLVTGLWFYFVHLFMDGARFSLWAKQRITYIVLAICAAIILVITLIKQSLFILPAYAFRKALFLEDMSLTQINIIMLVWLAVGLLALLYAQTKELSFKKGAPMKWGNMPRVNRIGMMTLYTLFALFLFYYLGQGEFQAMINHAAAVMGQADVEAFRDYLLSFGPWAAIISALLMVFQSVIAPLPAFVITFSNGLLFGWFYGAILSWSSAMAGAVLCFYIAKFVGRPVVEKIVTKKALEWWDGFFEKYGKHSVFIARLVPIVSFDLVSYAAGVTSIRFWHFFWATGLGQLPATILYSYLGQNATGTVQILFFLFTIVIALAVIGALLRPKFKFKKAELDS